MKYIVFMLSFIAAVWVFFDARQHGKGLIVSLLWCAGTQLTSSLLLVIWLLARPAYTPVRVVRDRD